MGIRKIATAAAAPPAPSGGLLGLADYGSDSDDEAQDAPVANAAAAAPAPAEEAPLAADGPET